MNNLTPKNLIIYLNKHFNVSEADMGNLPYTTTLEEDEKTGENILPMPKEVYGDYANIDDVMSFKKATRHRIRMVNLSCKSLKHTAFIRAYRSIHRQLYSSSHQLNRVILCTNKHNYLIRPLKN